MTTSQKMSLSSVTSLKDERIPPFELGYLTAAARDDAYDAFVSLFMSESKRDPRLTRAFIARRTGKSPEQITRYIGSPGNWTIDTYATLCAALGYRAVVRAEKISDMRRENSCHEIYTWKPPVSETPIGRQGGRVLLGADLNSLDKGDLQQSIVSYEVFSKRGGDLENSHAAWLSGARNPARQGFPEAQSVGNPVETWGLL